MSDDAAYNDIDARIEAQLATTKVDALDDSHYLDAIPHPADAIVKKEDLSATPLAECGTRRIGRFSNEWWNSTEELAHIALAADSQPISRESVLLSVLVNATAHIPPALKLEGPPREGTPNLVAVFPATPGQGKGSSLDMARHLLPLPNGVETQALGSAEGFVKSFFRANSDEKDKTNPMVRHSSPVVLRVDEIGALIAQTGRSAAGGENLIAQIKQAVSGEALGFGYADVNKRLAVKPLSYRTGLLCGAVPARADALFNDLGGGLPERMTFALAMLNDIPTDDEIDHTPAKPGPLCWSPPRMSASDGLGSTNIIPVAADVRHRMKLERLESLREQRRDPAGNDMRPHAVYNRLRLATAFAWLHGETTVAMRWYDLGSDLEEISNETQRWLRNQIGKDKAAAAERRRTGEVTTAVAKAEAVAKVEERNLAAQAIKDAYRVYEIVKELGDTSPRDIRRRMRTRTDDRRADAIEHALESKWITEREEIRSGNPTQILSLGPVTPKSSAGTQ